MSKQVKVEEEDIIVEEEEEDADLINELPILALIKP